MFNICEGVPGKADPGVAGMTWPVWKPAMDMGIGAGVPAPRSMGQLSPLLTKDGGEVERALLFGLPAVPRLGPL